MYFTVESLAMLEESKRKPKWFYAPKECITSVDFRGSKCVPEARKSDMKVMFTVGSEYILENIACKGFKPTQKRYKLIGVADSLHGVQLDSVIVKQVSGEIGRQFTLSEEDCELFNVEYEEGLIMLPKFMGWKVPTTHRKFDPMNLATTPGSAPYGYLVHFLIRVNGFHDLNGGYVVTPSGLAVREEDITASLTVKSKIPLVFANETLVIGEGSDVGVRIVTPKLKGLIYKYGNFISSDDSMYLHITLEDFSTVGIDQTYVEGVHPFDMFDIMWDESHGMTQDEFKKKEETERKRKAEKENRVNSMVTRARKSVDESITRMQGDIQFIHKGGPHIVITNDPNFGNISIDDFFKDLSIKETIESKLRNYGLFHDTH